MSYCRWSSDNWRCDLYCYEHVDGGWTTHVAARKRVGLDALPNVPDVGTVDPQTWIAAYQAQMAALEKLEFADITLPHAGETFSDPTLEDFKARLLMLKELGYSFPDYVLEAVDGEIADRDAAQAKEVR